MAKPARSPFARFCLVFLAVSAIPRVAAALVPDDREALQALDTATLGVLRTSAGWDGLAGTECSGSWAGVKCDPAGERVTQLLLGQHQIHLALTGSLPPQIGKLTALTQLELTDQGLSGTLPGELGRLVNMAHLDLRGNGFTGGSAAASGLAPFLSMRQLRFLNLEGNRLSGPIPGGIGDLTALTNLELTGNALTGSIPPDLGRLTNLTKLWLDANQLEGEIPPDLEQLVHLTELRLGGNALVGRIPEMFGQLRDLEILQIGLCRLTGPLPATISELSSLVELSVGTNQLGGELDLVNWARLSSLQRVHLDNNSLEGEIPPDLLALRSLVELRLQGNRLTGAVSSSILARPTPLALDLRWNALTADSAVATLLGNEFSRTQTRAPGGFQASGTEPTAVRLRWELAGLQEVPGRYVISYRPAGFPDIPPSTLAVPGKQISHTVVGNLLAATDYEFRIQTVSDAHAANQNTVTSDSGPSLIARGADTAAAGRAILSLTEVGVAEGQSVRVAALREGGVAGTLAISARLLASGSAPATIGRDLELDSDDTLRWLPGEGGAKEIVISAAADARSEPIESATIRITPSTPDGVGTPASARVDVLDRAVAGTVDQPVVATSADGLELSVWTVVDEGGALRDVHGRFTAGLAGETKTGQFVIAGGPADEFDPAVLALGNDLVVLWAVADDIIKGTWVAYCRIDRRTGQCREEPKHLVTDSSRNEFTATADGSRFWLTWRAQSGIRLAAFDKLGRLTGRRELVTGDPDARNPRVARLATGAMFVLWGTTVPSLPGTARRPALQGRALVDGTFQPVVPDLAGADIVELRDARLLGRPGGGGVLSWIGVRSIDTPSGPLRDRPRIHLRRLSPSGALDGSPASLGCGDCNESIGRHSVAPLAGSGDCLATWVSLPPSGNAAPSIRRATLSGCFTPQVAITVQLTGTTSRIRDFAEGSTPNRLLVLERRSTANTLDLRAYRCSGAGQCQN